MALPAKKILAQNTILKTLESATDSLTKAVVEAPRLNAETLICHVLKCNKTDFYTNPDKYLTDDEIDSITALVKRRTLREPLQYIIGKQGFWSLDFKVTKDVLIPRPETEIIIEEAIKLVAHNSRPTAILDLCTGSGCIAITLAKKLPNAVIYATDVSNTALLIAKENAEMYGVLRNIKFIHGDIFDALNLRAKGNKIFDPCPLTHDPISFDLIVSNPPYIKTSDIKTLEPEIKNFEPTNALDGGEDGLKIIKRIIDNAHNYLKKHGWLMMEIGIGQTLDVKTLLEKSGHYDEISITKDYSGIERVIKAKRK